MTETKTEARERMSDQRFERLRLIDVSGGNVVRPVTWSELLTEAERARASEASLTAALSALRAEHQRVQGQLAEMRAALEMTHDGLREFLGGEDLDPQEAATMSAARRALALEIDGLSGWVSPEEHQRVVAERDRALKDTALAGAMCEVLHRFALHEGAENESPVATLTRICEDRIWRNDMMVRFRKERDSLGAQLAASEEKARGLAAENAVLRAQRIDQNSAPPLCHKGTGGFPTSDPETACFLPRDHAGAHESKAGLMVNGEYQRRTALAPEAAAVEPDGHVLACGNGGEDPSDCAPSCVLVASALASPAPRVGAESEPSPMVKRAIERFHAALEGVKAGRPVELPQPRPDYDAAFNDGNEASDE